MSGFVDWEDSAFVAKSPGATPWESVASVGAVRAAAGAGALSSAVAIAENVG